MPSNRRRRGGSRESNRIVVVKIQAWTRLAQTTVKALAVFGCFYWVYRSIEDLSGQQTDANVVVRFILGLGFSRGVAYVFGGAGMIYGLRQKALRDRTVKRLGSRVRELEARVDPNRSTSHLDERGHRPNEGDLGKEA